MVATLLDPRFKALLDNDQIQYARKECLKYLMSSDRSDDCDDCTNTIPQAAFSSHCILTATWDHLKSVLNQMIWQCTLFPFN